MRLFSKGGQILGARAGQVVLGALIGLTLARVLGPQGQGHYSLSVAVIMLVAAVVNGGVGLAAVPSLRRGEVRLGRMLAAQGVWLLGVGVLVLVLGLALASVGSVRELAGARLAWNASAAAAAGLGILALCAFEILFYDLLAIGRVVTGPAVNLARAGLHALLVAGLLLAARLELATAVLAYAAAQLAAALTVSHLLRRLAADGAVAVATGPAEAGPSLVGLIRVTLRRGWSGQVSAVASLLHLRLDLALVSWYHGASVVGVYSVAVMIGELLWQLPGALSPVLVYTSAAAGEGGERDATAARAVRVGLAVTAVAAAILALAIAPLLRLFSLEAYAGSAPALRAILPGIVAFAPGAVLAGDFIGRGRPAWNAQASLLTVAVNVAAGLALIPRHGAVGASWASTIAYTVGAAAMILRFRHATGLSWRTILIPCRGDLGRGTPSPSRGG
jgi:O-antigen/teichoic acid export membrane protein